MVGSLAEIKEAQPFSGRPRQDRRLGCFARPCVELCHLLCFVCGRGSASTRPPPGGGEVQPHQFQRYFSRQGEVCFASPCVELCHLLCFVCGRGSASTRPPPGSGGSSHTSFSQASTRFFQAGGCPTNLARQPCRELRKCSLFRDVQGEIDAWAASQARVELCHLLCFVCGRGSPQVVGRSSHTSFSQVRIFFQAGGCPTRQAEA